MTGEATRARSRGSRRQGRDPSSFWRANGLSLTLAGLFAAALAAQVWAGYRVHGQELLEHGEVPVSIARYLLSGHFISATFENWESEFLQMAMYVLLSVMLRQRGSAESRPLDPAEEEPRIEPGETPWPARAGGWIRVLYGHSLAIAFGMLFALSFALHAYGSWRHELQERLQAGELPVSFLAHLASAQFWFESFQNWQSEFLAVLALVVASIWLRQKESPQSKPVDAPHSQTGT